MMQQSQNDITNDSEHVHHEQRSAASSAGGSMALAQYPAQGAAQLKAENAAVAQLYYISNHDGIDYQFSDTVDMGVSVPDSQYFHVAPDIGVAPNVLKLHHQFPDSGNRIYTMNVGYIQDCGEYANSLLYKIANVNRQTHTPSLKTYQQDSPQPGVGEAFFVQSDPIKDKEAGKSHFNHHWGVVVAKSGNDVITAEADSTKAYMAFHMYNASNFGQSFKDVYVSKNKLDKSAQMFLARIEATPKQSQQGSSSNKVDVEILDD